MTKKIQNVKSLEKTCIGMFMVTLPIIVKSLKLPKCSSKREGLEDFPHGPVVKNPLSDTGDVGSIPGWGTKIPHAMGQISPRATTTEPVGLNERALAPQTTEPMHSGACAPQLERSPRAATKEPVHRKRRSRVLRLRTNAAKNKLN